MIAFCDKTQIYLPGCGQSGGGGDCTLEELSVTTNGHYEPEEFDGYSSVDVNVQQRYQEKYVEENGVVRPDAGYDGLSKVTVNVVYGYKSPHTYGNADFYLAALMGESTETVEYYDPDSHRMYDVTIPNGLNVLQWDNTAMIGS